MKRLFVSLSLVGCYHGTEPQPVAQRVPPPPSAHRTTSMLDTWETYAKGRIEVRTPAGPFGELESICDKLDRDEGDDCKVFSTGEIEGSRLAIGSVRATATVNADMGAPPQLVEHVGVRVPAGGWYVLPRFAHLEMLHNSGLGVTPEIVDGVLLLRYQETEGNKWSGDTKQGIVACIATSGSVACTPKIVLRSSTYNTGDRMDPGGIQTTSLACVAKVARHAITIAPMEQPADAWETWSAEAAEACTTSLAGTHRVAF